MSAGTNGSDIRERRTLMTVDAVRLSARPWLVEGTPRAAVVLVHGFGAHAEESTVVTMVDALRARDLDVIVYDARGHGASEGSSTLGDLEEHDVAAAVRCAEERADRVVVVGASMGAIATLRFASRPHPSIAGVVALSCPARWSLPLTPRAIAAALLVRTLPGRMLAERALRVRISAAWNQPAPPHELIARVSAPVAVIHGARDSFIPPGAAQELYDHAPDPRSLRIVDEMGHAFSTAAVDPVCEAIEWALSTSGPRRRLAG